MKIQINYKKITFCAIAFTLLFSIISLFYLWLKEKEQPLFTAPEHLTISGTYFTESSKERNPLPETGNIKLPNKTDTVTVVGHFNQDIPENKIISFRLDNMYIRMYVNNELAYSYGEPGSIVPHIKSSGSGWRYFTSPGISAADDVKLELSNLYANHVSSSYRDFFQGLSMGNPAGRIASNLQYSFTATIISIFIIFMGLMQLIYALALVRTKTDGNRYFALAGLSIFSGFWFCIDFNTAELFFPYPIVNNVLQTLSLFLALCYMLLYVSTSLTGVRQICLRICSWIVMLTTVCCTLGSWINGHDTNDFALLLYIMLAFSAFIILLNLCLEYARIKEPDRKRQLLPLFFLLAGALLDIILSYSGIVPYLIFELTFFLFSCWQIHTVWSSVNRLAHEQANMALLKEDHERQKRLLEYQILLSQSTKGLYESIYELDITHNCAGDDGTRAYFESLGLAASTPYNLALYHIVQKQVHSDFREGYLEMFSPDSVLAQYEKGMDAIQYDFRTTNDGQNYYWIRMDARIFFWNVDQSVRMITYRQNIDAEKQQELLLKSQAQTDQLTGLLNREAVEQGVKELVQGPFSFPLVCCIIFDVDDFKDINDSLGHQAGDFALVEFARVLKEVFASNDIIGRLGGDEFIVFTNISRTEVVQHRIDEFQHALASASLEYEGTLISLHASIGVACASKDQASFEQLYRHSDNALYVSKKSGKNQYTFYEKSY